jgi:hypothetical protein
LADGAGTAAMSVDLNGDGLLDVLVMQNAGPQATWAVFQRSIDVWDTAVPLPGIGRPLALTDVDGDGYVDLVLANPLSVAWGSQRGIDPAAARPIAGATDDPSYDGVLPSDLDGDGRTDLVLSQWSRGTPICSRRGAKWDDVASEFDGIVGYPQNPIQGLEVFWGVAIVDVDGDGRDDIAVAGGNDAGHAGILAQAGVSHTTVFFREPTGFREEDATQCGPVGSACRRSRGRAPGRSSYAALAVSISSMFAHTGPTASARWMSRRAPSRGSSPIRGEGGRS